MQHKTNRTANAALLLMALIWAANFPFAKVALRQIPPLAFNALRFPLASLTLLALLMRQPTVPRIERADFKRIFLLGIIGNLFYQQFFTFGLAYSRAGSASILLAGTPIVTALLSSFLGHERVKPRVWIGLCCTVAGIALVVAFGSQTSRPGENSLLGAALMFSASLTWAVYTVGSRKLVDKYGPILITTWTVGIGAIFIVLTGVPDMVRLRFNEVTPIAWLAVVYAGVVSLGIAYAIWYYGVEQLGNTRTSTYSNLVPALAVLIAWIVLGEQPTLGQIAGAAVIIGGVTLAQSSNRG